MALIAGKGSNELRGLLPEVVAAAMPGFDPFSETPPPSRRRARREDVVTYRVRIDLAETKPPLWRRLDLASDMFLNELHDVIQTAFGWTDSHLHEFASGKDYYDLAAEHYLCPFQVAEGEIGVPEEEVRLDEVLAAKGDKLLYLYDFGDDWMHVIKLEAVQARHESAPRAACVDGRRPGPSEDCGGVHGYELICAALDAGHPDHAAAVRDYARLYGKEVDPGDYAPTLFSSEEINRYLTGNGESGLSGPLGELLDAIDSPRPRRIFQQMIQDADLDNPVDIDAETAARMVSPYTWLLDRVGADGIKLTGAGYLPPVHVEAAVAELGLGKEWIGKGNREVQTLPVLVLRETAQAVGLLRKHKGALVLTPRGRAVRDDPLALWWYLAEHLPPASKWPFETQAGLICLTALAAGWIDDVNSTIADWLTAAGWGDIDGTPVSRTMANDAAWDTMSVLRRLRAVDKGPGWRDVPTPEGATFARAALRSWPSTS
ncbi:pRiA4b ORF-3-like protein [Kribbella sp. VKM Ac-2569]|nr:pRiA4b ORF-3-like protein [Kribbella sp. VKM Ac-2569]